jgi:hypothetical protein
MTRVDSGQRPTRGRLLLVRLLQLLVRLVQSLPPRLLVTAVLLFPFVLLFPLELLVAYLMSVPLLEASLLFLVGVGFALPFALPRLQRELGVSYPEHTPLTQGQQIFARVVDLAVMIALMIVIIYAFGGLHVHGSTYKIELREMSFLVWLVCVIAYYQVPKLWGSETPGKVLSRQLGRRLSTATMSTEQVPDLSTATMSTERVPDLGTQPRRRHQMRRRRRRPG